MIDITDRIEEFQNNPKYKDSQNIHKIHCINPYDNEALCDIFNTYNPLITFEKEYEDDNIFRIWTKNIKLCNTNI
jgi:hypothetical protein